MRQQQQMMMTMVLVVIIVAVVMYFTLKPKKTTANPKNPKTGSVTASQKASNPGKAKPGSSSTTASADDIDSSGDVSVGDTVVMNYAMSVPIVKKGPGPTVNYIPANGLFSGTQLSQDFDQWDVVGTISDIYDEGDDDVYAIIQTPPDFSSGWDTTYYEVSIYDCQQQ